MVDYERWLSSLHEARTIVRYGRETPPNAVLAVYDPSKDVLQVISVADDSPDVRSFLEQYVRGSEIVGYYEPINIEALIEDASFVRLNFIEGVID